MKRELIVPGSRVRVLATERDVHKKVGTVLAIKKVGGRLLWDVKLDVG